MIYFRCKLFVALLMVVAAQPRMAHSPGAITFDDMNGGTFDSTLMLDILFNVENSGILFNVPKTLIAEDVELDRGPNALQFNGINFLLNGQNSDRDFWPNRQVVHDDGTGTFYSARATMCGFAPDVTYGVGDEPQAVAIGDLDGDLDLDLAVANRSDNGVSVLLNNGDGSFAADVTYGAGNAPASLVIGDLDGDLDLDLVVANIDSLDVSVLLNNGDGTFATGLTYGAGSEPVSVAIGDLDGDLDLDLAVANIFTDVSVLLNNGDGTFAARVSYGAGDAPYFVAIGDLDGDLDLDLAVADIFTDVSVLLNNGNGTFAAGVSYGAGDSPVSVAIGDLDGDLDLDLAVANVNSLDVSVLLNNGDGTFAADVTYGAGNGPVSVAIGDLDGDLDLDLAVTNVFTDVSVLLNNGDGTFSTGVNYGAGNAPISVAIGDLDGDLDLDLAVANNLSDDVSVLLNNSDRPCATDGVLVEGVGQINDVCAACVSDDSYWAAHGASLFFQVSDPVVQFELIATAPAGFGGRTITVDIEASKQSVKANLILRAQMFNFTSVSYVALPGIMPLATADSVQSFALPTGSDPADFIEPGTNEVRLLLQTIQTSGFPNVRTQLDEVLFNFE